MPVHEDADSTVASKFGGCLLVALHTLFYLHPAGRVVGEEEEVFHVLGIRALLIPLLRAGTHYIFHLDPARSFFNSKFIS